MKQRNAVTVELQLFCRRTGTRNSEKRLNCKLNLAILRVDFTSAQNITSRVPKSRFHKLQIKTSWFISSWRHDELTKRCFPIDIKPTSDFFAISWTRHQTIFALGYAQWIKSRSNNHSKQESKLRFKWLTVVYCNNNLRFVNYFLS